MPPAARDNSPRRPGRPRDAALAARRRDEILRCATHHFARVGFDGADLDAVAADLGCAKGTLYRYFPNKRALFTECADLCMRSLLTRTRASVSRDPLVRIEHAIRAYLAFFDEHPEYVELLIQERAAFKDRAQSTYFQYREANAEPWRELLRRLRREGRLRAIPVDRAFEVIGDLLYGTIFTNALSGRRRSLKAQATDVLDVLLHGLLKPAGATQRPGSRTPAAAAPRGAPRRKSKGGSRGG